MLVAVFDNENKAFEGLSSLKDLHKKGDITLYATAVVSKSEKGELRLDTAADQGPVGTGGVGADEQQRDHNRRGCVSDEHGRRPAAGQARVAAGPPGERHR